MSFGYEEDGIKWSDGKEYYNGQRVFRYAICDCEHEGDVNEAMRDIRDCGGVVVGWYWGGGRYCEDYGEVASDDCDEAYVKFVAGDGVDENELLKKLGMAR